MLVVMLMPIKLPAISHGLPSAFIFELGFTLISWVAWERVFGVLECQDVIYCRFVSWSNGAVVWRSIFAILGV